MVDREDLIIYLVGGTVILVVMGFLAVHRKILYLSVLIVFVGVCVVLHATRNYRPVPCYCGPPPFWGICETGDKDSKECQTLNATSEALTDLATATISPNTWDQFSLSEPIPPVRKVQSDPQYTADEQKHAIKIREGIADIQHGIRSISKGVACVHFPEKLPVIPKIKVPSTLHDMTKSNGKVTYKPIPALDMSHRSGCNIDVDAIGKKIKDAASDAASDVKKGASKAIKKVGSWL